MRLVLDEMWNPAIAVELRKRGHDVIAAQEPAHRDRYCRIADELVFERAQADGRTVVTDNVGDFEHQRQCWETRGSAHQGVIYAVEPHFNRHTGSGAIGLMVKALDAFLTVATTSPGPAVAVHYLRPAG